MKLTPVQIEAERAEQARIDAKLANFGDKAGQHGPLAAVTVRLPPLRVDRETNIRLINLSRALGFRGRTTPLRMIMLNVFSRVAARDFHATVADLEKRAMEG